MQNLEAPFGKGFNFVRAKPPLRRAESRFAEPRTSRKGTVLFFSLVRKEPKVPQRFANLWTPGTIQSSVGEDFSRVFRRHEPKPFFRTKRRRKGFESVRKGYRSADARLMFFEKELLYSKLTVASDIRKGLLHVSLGAVRNCCRGAPRNSISLSVSFA